jgi:protoporphyrin/coproporphyrin ferrochelatase
VFDAVLVISFGGPQGPDDIRPFLANVLRGRRVSPERVEEVAHHYELFGGVSPITHLTLRQAEGLRDRLASAGHPLPVYVGMRNWHPDLADTLQRMYDDGVRSAIGFIAAAHHSYSSCQQYRENVDAARVQLRAARGGDIAVTYVDSWFEHPLFVEANARHIETALTRLPADMRADARIVFTAHSIPSAMADGCRYREQLLESARLVADRLDREWALVYQSRSGRPGDPWLEPDVCDYLRRERKEGLAAAVISPIGFVCDHIEVLYDLDYEAAHVCAEVGVAMTRAASANDDPLFLDMMADVVRRTIQRYRGVPLPLARPPAAPAV